MCDLWMPHLVGVGPEGTYVVILSTDRQSALRDLLHERLFANRPDGSFMLLSSVWDSPR